MCVCVCACLSPDAYQSRRGPRFPKEPFSVRAGRADLNPDHHKHTPLFYNKSRLPKTAPKVSMCWKKKMDSTGTEGETGGEKTNQIYTLLSCWRRSGVCKSRKSIQIDLEERSWGPEIGLYAPAAPQGSLDHGYSPPCSLRYFDISALAQSLILAFGQIFSRLRRACALRDERVLWYSC